MHTNSIFRLAKILMTMCTYACQTNRYGVESSVGQKVVFLMMQESVRSFKILLTCV